MLGWLRTLEVTRVALRKESVDRNATIHNTEIDKFKSLSVRRAWIEIVPVRQVDVQQHCRSP